MVGPCIWLAYNSSREKECHPSRFPRPCSGRGPRRERFVWEWGLEFSIEVVTTNESCYVHIYIAYLERFNLVVEQLARFAHPARAAPCSAVLLALWTTICFFFSIHVEWSSAERKMHLYCSWLARRHYVSVLCDYGKENIRFPTRTSPCYHWQHKLKGGDCQAGFSLVRYSSEATAEVVT